MDSVLQHPTEQRSPLHSSDAAHVDEKNGRHPPSSAI